MPERRYGNKFSYRKPPEVLPDVRHSIRSRIIEESSAAAQQDSRKPQQKFYKAPAFPGTSAFDLKTGETLPPAKRQHTASQNYDLPDMHQHEEEEVEEVENADTWSDYTYHSRVLAELESIKTASSPTSLNHEEAHSHSTHNERLSDTLITKEVAAAGSTDAGLTPATTSTFSWRSSTDINLTMNPVGPHELAIESHTIYSELANSSNALQYKLDLYRSPFNVPDDKHAEICMIDYFNVLQRHYEFAQATQHPSAPKSLRTLAARYAMPHRLWQRVIKQTFDIILECGNESTSMLAYFADLVYYEMDKLSHNVPQMALHWELIQHNVRQYFEALHADGIDVPLRFIADPVSNYPSGPRQATAIESTLPGAFFGDDQLCENYFHNHLQDHLNAVHVDYLRQYDLDGGLMRTGPIMMGGWLAYGRKLARSFHEFCQTFLFLGFVCDMHHELI